MRPLQNLLGLELLKKWTVEKGVWLQNPGLKKVTGKTRYLRADGK